MQPTQTSAGRRVFSYLGLIIIVGLLLVIWQRQAVYDQLRLIGYQPDADVAQLASDTSMTDRARRIYYVNHPDMQDKSEFSEQCPAGTEQTVVLGCYKTGQQGIYLLQVTNEELKGIEQVTAAHEMLHAAYDRLSNKERQRVDAMLQQYYQSHLSDETIKQTIEDYKQTEPDDLINEMHSIFGTQIKDLPADLNSYYSQYFTERDKITDYYKTYEDAFNTRRQQIKYYDAQLNSEKKQIDQLKASTEAQSEALKSQRETLDSYRALNQVEAYNNGVGSYNAAVSRYNNDVSRLQELIKSYNLLVTKRNAIAFEERQLVQSLSSPAQTR